MNINNSEVCGVDEAGRGPWAGPVVASAVILNNINNEIANSLQDSKKISEKKRIVINQNLLDCAKNQELVYGVGIASVEEIDKLNILQATFLAMKRAIFICQAQHKKDFYLWVDGTGLPKFTEDELIVFPIGFQKKNHAIIKGDALISAISAASIIAKTWRDKLMYEYDLEYPQYGFAKHKGYGTAIHLKALEAHGICSIHRKTYKPIKKYL